MHLLLHYTLLLEHFTFNTQIRTLNNFSAEQMSRWAWKWGSTTAHLCGSNDRRRSENLTIMTFVIFQNRSHSQRLHTSPRSQKKNSVCMCRRDIVAWKIRISSRSRSHDSSHSIFSLFCFRHVCRFFREPPTTNWALIEHSSRHEACTLHALAIILQRMCFVGRQLSELELGFETGIGIRFLYFGIF